MFGISAMWLLSEGLLPISRILSGNSSFGQRPLLRVTLGSVARSASNRQHLKMAVSGTSKDFDVLKIISFILLMFRKIAN